MLSIFKEGSLITNILVRVSSIIPARPLLSLFEFLFHFSFFPATLSASPFTTLPLYLQLPHRAASA